LASYDLSLWKRVWSWGGELAPGKKQRAAVAQRRNEGVTPVDYTSMLRTHPTRDSRRPLAGPRQRAILLV